MTGWLQWARDVVGGFGAGFLAYVVAGSLFSFVVTLVVAKSGSMCPTDMFGALVVGCQSGLASAFWYAAADLPSGLLVSAYVVIVEAVTPNPNIIGYDAWFWPTGGLSIACSVVGFFAWRTRSPAVAWTLLMLLLVEVAMMILLAWTPGRTYGGGGD